MVQPSLWSIVEGFHHLKKIPYNYQQSLSQLPPFQTFLPTTNTHSTGQPPVYILSLETSLKEVSLKEG